MKVVGKEMSSQNSPRIVGITGSFGSGSSEIAGIFRDRYEYHLIKISDFLREEAKKRKIYGLDGKAPFWKKKRILQDLGNELRLENHDNGYLVRHVLTKNKEDGINKSIVIDCIKNPGEVLALKEYPNAYVVAVNAPKDVRWERNKEKYANKLDEFEKDDERDKNEGLPHGQNVQKCVDLADIYVTNDKHWRSWRIEEEFKEKIDQYVEIIGSPGSRRPSDEELYMNNAYHTSLLSDCLKRQVGAIITMPRSSRRSQPLEEQRKYVIASGYNAVPESERSCRIEHDSCYRDLKWEEYLKDVKYCPNCGKRLSKSKRVFRRCPTCETDFMDLTPSKALDLCRAIHAEESAILQTSRLGGISLEGTTLYTTTHPCLLCAKKIISAGIDRVIWLEAYPDGEAADMLINAGIKLEEFEGVKAQAFYQLFHRTS